MLVRVFPSQTDSVFALQGLELYDPATWVLDQPTGAMFYTLAVTGGRIQISEAGSRADVDPQTLQLTNVHTSTPQSPTPP